MNEPLIPSQKPEDQKQNSPSISATPQQPPQNSFKLIILAIAILFVTILFFFGYQWYLTNQQTNLSQRTITQQPTPTTTQKPTAEWETYSNAQYSFSLNHPSSWQVTEGNQHAPSMPKDMINLQSKVGTFDISIISMSNDQNKNLQEELNSFIKNFLGDFEIQYENIMLSNLSGVKGSYTQSALGSETKIVILAIEKGDNIFFFQYQEGLDEIQTNLYNQILSTFKFIEEDSSNYKVHTVVDGNGFGYEVKLPTYWRIGDWGGGGATPSPIEIAKIFTNQSDQCSPQSETIRILHFEIPNPSKIIQNSINSLTSDGFSHTTLKSSSNTTVEMLTGNINGNAGYYAYIISPTGYFDISGKKICSSSDIEEVLNNTLTSFQIINEK